MPYRLVYTLRIRFEGDNPGTHEIIANLLPNCTNRLKSGARPRPEKKRIVDLRVGDEALIEGRWRKVLRISTFFERTVSDEEAAKHAAQPDAEGWATKVRGRSTFVAGCFTCSAMVLHVSMRRKSWQHSSDLHETQTRNVSDALAKFWRSIARTERSTSSKYVA